MDFVGLIKAECGQQFVSRVEQMYNDIDQSLEQNKAFRSADPRKRKHQEFESEFFILSQASWPISQAQLIVMLPKEIQDAQG